MGFLQNHAIKKSCKGLAKALLNYVVNYVEQLPENKISESTDFYDLILAGLKDFVDNSHNLSDLDVDLKSIKYSNWAELYFALLVEGVYADLSYDPRIRTADHDVLIVEIGRQVYDSFEAEMGIS